MILQDRIEQTVALAKQGESEKARAFALALVREFPQEADVWALLSQIVDSPDLAAYCLKKVLEFSDNGRILGWAEARLAEIDPDLIPDNDPFDLYDPSNLLKGDFFSQPRPDKAITTDAAAPMGQRQPKNSLGIGMIILAVVVLVGIASLLTVNGVIGLSAGRVNIATIPPPAMTVQVIMPDESSQPTAPPVSANPIDLPAPTSPRASVDQSASPTMTVVPSLTPTPLATEAPGPPASVSISAPAAGAVLREVPFSIQWERVSGAERYAVNIVSTEGERAIESDEFDASELCRGSTCELVDLELNNGGYTVTVTASNTFGASQSPSNNFVVNSPMDFTFELGGQVPGGIARPDLMQRVGMTWVKYQVIYEVTPVDAAAELVAQGRQYGFKVLLSITGETYPEELDFAGYNAYLAQVAQLQPDAIEVWNEMNLETEWPVGEISPEQYVTEMLAPAYSVIKQTSPETIVVIGALASTGVDNKVTVWSDDSYIDGLNEAGAAQFADCMGTHHNGGATSPRVQTGHSADQTGHHSWYYLPTLEVAYEGMEEALPLCITEFGYLTPEGYPPLAQDWLWAQQTTIADQAEWLAEGVRMAQELGYVRFVIVWNVDFSRYDIDPQGGFAILRPDNTCPACETLARVMQ